MRSGIVIVALILFNLFGFAAFALYGFLSSPVDYVVLATIPKYSNSENWKLDAGSGFPDGAPGGDISFETNANSDEIDNFYQNFLAKAGWQKVDLKTTLWNDGSAIAAYKKRIGFHTFNMEIGKPGKASNGKNPRVIIFLNHRER